MCGIAGLISLDNPAPIDTRLLDRMTDSLAHRGPDGRGVWIGEGAGIGHRRLAIVDLAGGAQPWQDPHGRAILTYNGELYNHRRLRTELEGHGVGFRSNCDTEVLLQAILHWGLETALEKFRGMFAFAMWEPRQRRLTLARDPMGVKPAYWAIHDGILRFGSEPKAILADPAFPRTVDLTALVNYLAHYRLSFDGRTLFGGIRELEPGTYIQWTGGKMREVRYWRIPAVRESDKIDPGEEGAVTGFQHKLNLAVRRRMMADVPVGAYLSGGIDSAVLVTLMRMARGNKPLHTFSIGFKEGDANEFPFSRLMAERLGTLHEQVTMTQDGYFKEFESLIHIKDTPLSVPNEVPLRYLSRFIKRRVTVVLSGEGADELLAGYTLLSRSPHDAWLASRLASENGTVEPGVRAHLENALRNTYGDAAFAGQREQFLHLYQWMPRSSRAGMFRGDIPLDRAEGEIRGSWDARWDRLDSTGLDSYEKVLNILQEVHLRALLLRLDATSMAEGVEGRVPYTDRDLVEWAAALPLKYKLRWSSEAAEEKARSMTAWESAGTLDIGKYILRLSFAEMIPPEILMRPKSAFPVPLDTWLYGPRAEWTKDRVLTAKMGELFDLKVLESMLDNTRGVQEGMRLWMLANVGIWLEMYFTRQTESLPTP